MTGFNINIRDKMFPLKVGNNEKKNVIFKNFDLKINTGELICIFGPSGCGKTTLLNLISNLDNNFNGLISYNNKKIIQKSELWGRELKKKPFDQANN